MASSNDGSETKDVVFGENVCIAKHPVLYHKISILRSSETPAGTFRNTLREVTYHLGYEATSKSLTTREIPLSVPVGKESTEQHVNFYDGIGHKIVERVALIPILRSGLGMSNGFLELLPNAAVHHIGMYHIPGSVPVQYFNRLPKKCNSDVAYVLDPVIASAETMLSVISILKKWGVPKIHVVTVLASKQGLSKIQELHPDIHVTVGMMDDILTKEGVVLPGLGDAGNRLFGTDPIRDTDDESLLHPSKRKRSDVGL